LLRALREKAGLSQSALARRAGLDPSFINRLESGQRGAERAVAEALVLALELPPEEADRLRAAGGYLPPDLARLGLDDPTLRLVVQVLTDDQVSPAEREAFRQTVAAARRGLHDPTLDLVAQILADERLGDADRAAFRQVVELIGRRWRPGSEPA
jgi:transcriptional regulator with XRE-family HTH domain